MKYLDGISDEDIVELNIPTGIPLVYELDASLRRFGTTTWGIRRRRKRAAEAVANQAAAGERTLACGYSTSFSGRLVGRDAQRLEEAAIVGAHLERRRAASAAARRALRLAALVAIDEADDGFERDSSRTRRRAPSRGTPRRAHRRRRGGDRFGQFARHWFTTESMRTSTCASRETAERPATCHETSGEVSNRDGWGAINMR